MIESVIYLAAEDVYVDQEAATGDDLLAAAEQY